jgi:AI-2 transport protein TqsA
MSTPQDVYLQRLPDGLARVFFSLAIMLLVGYLLYVGRSIFIPLTISLFLAFLIVSLKSAIRAIPKVGRFIPQFLAFILAFATIVLVMISLAEIVRRNIDALITDLPLYQARLTEVSTAAMDWLDRNISFADDLVDGLKKIQQDLLGQIPSLVGDIGIVVRTLAASLVTIFLYTAFMLVERGRFLRKIAKLSTSRADREHVNDIIRDISDLLAKYISIKTLMNMIVASISFLIMYSLGIKYAGFWALMSFALNYIPIIGSIIGVLMPTLLALVQPGGGVGLSLLTLTLLTGAEQFFGSFVEPRTVGKSLNLSPLVILLSLALWGSLWGFAGMLLCVPITVAALIIFSQIEETRALAILISDNGDIAPIRRKEKSA